MKAKRLVQYAKSNRKKRTPAELAAFKHLQRWGIRFRSQRCLGFYIVDFLIFQKWIVVEIDGSYHNTDEQKLYDAERTKYLESIGLKVVRFTNKQVFNEANSIKEVIESYPNKKVDFPYVPAQY